jgi:hypothetical protein
METLEKETFEPPVINSWRQVLPPTAGQLAYATGLCRTELPYAERVHTLATFPALDSQEISALIDELAEVRAKRLKRLRRSRRGRR